MRTVGTAELIIGRELMRHSGHPMADCRCHGAPHAPGHDRKGQP